MLPVFILSIVTLWSRYYFKSWFAPGSFFSLFWLVLTITPLLMTSEFTVQSFGVWYITAFCFAVVLGSLIVSNIEHNNYTNVGNEFVHRYINNKASSLLFLLTIFFTIISAFGIIVAIFIGIGRYELSLNLISLTSLPNLFYVDRDTGVFSLPITIRLFMYFVYTAALLAGITMKFTNGKKRLIVFSPIAVSVLYGAILAVRSGILFAIILFISGYAATTVFAGDRKVSIKILIYVSLSAFSFVTLFIAIQWLRAGADDSFIISMMLDRSKIFFFGHISVFTQWLNNYHFEQLYFGSRTFAGPLNLVGLANRAAGVYEYFMPIGNGHYSNIYTVFRGIIEDFSIPGSLAFGIIFGAIGNISFQKCLRSHMLWIVPLSFFYAFTMYSPIISIFNYNSMILALIIASIIMFLLRLITYTANERYSYNNG